MLLLACPRPKQAQRALRATEVLRVIDLNGAQTALASYFQGDTAQRSELFDGVASGASDWLTVAARLRPASDGGASSELDLAVAEALPRAPARVLRLLPTPFSIRDVCGVPFVEQSDSASRAYRRRALAAVAGVQDPSLGTVRDQCLRELREATPITIPPAA